MSRVPATVSKYAPMTSAAAALLNPSFIRPGCAVLSAFANFTAPTALTPVYLVRTSASFSARRLANIAMLPRFLNTSSCPLIVPAAITPAECIRSNVCTLLIIDAFIASNTLTDAAIVVASSACAEPIFSCNASARRLYTKSRSERSLLSRSFLLYPDMALDISPSESSSDLVPLPGVAADF